jgi:hypothetical protein
MGISEINMKYKSEIPEVYANIINLLKPCGPML